MSFIERRRGTLGAPGEVGKNNSERIDPNANLWGGAGCSGWGDCGYAWAQEED